MKLYNCDGCGEQVCVDGPLDNNDTCEVMYEIHAVYQLISSKTVNKGTREGHLFCNNCIEKLIPKKDEESFKLMEPAGYSNHDGSYEKCPYCGEIYNSYDRIAMGLKNEEPFECKKCKRKIAFRP